MIKMHSSQMVTEYVDNNNKYYLWIITVTAVKVTLEFESEFDFGFMARPDTVLSWFCAEKDKT